MRANYVRYTVKRALGVGSFYTLMQNMVWSDTLIGVVISALLTTIWGLRLIAISLSEF